MGRSSVIAYGIDCEQSDIRAHVSAKSATCYIFKTAHVRSLLTTGEYKQTYGYQPAVAEPTAVGFLVPINRVNVLYQARLSTDEVQSIRTVKSTARKGAAAESVVVAMLRSGRLNLPVVGRAVCSGEASIRVVSDRTEQIAGYDLVVVYGSYALRIQVKCDFLAGPISLGCSGNFYIQTHESNPLRQF